MRMGWSLNRMQNFITEILWVHNIQQFEAFYAAYILKRSYICSDRHLEVAITL